MEQNKSKVTFPAVNTLKTHNYFTHETGELNISDSEISQAFKQYSLLFP